MARLLGETSVITSLNLCDNEVHGEGGKALGRVLTRNRSLLSLNLRLNRLGDDGGRLLAEGLRANRALRELNCCGNAFAVEVRFTHAAQLATTRDRWGTTEYRCARALSLCVCVCRRHDHCHRRSPIIGH